MAKWAIVARIIMGGLINYQKAIIGILTSIYRLGKVGFWFGPDGDPGAELDQKCGSGLARDSGVSVTGYLAEPPYSRASPLPHFDLLASGR
jgi:hypothetical protein